MEVPQNILDLFAKFKAPAAIEPNTSLVLERVLPKAIDHTRSFLAVSKPGRKSKGSFVNVYFRKTRSLTKKVEPSKYDQLWRDLNDLIERTENGTILHADFPRGKNSANFGGKAGFLQRKTRSQGQDSQRSH